MTCKECFQSYADRTVVLCPKHAAVDALVKACEAVVEHFENTTVLVCGNNDWAEFVAMRDKFKAALEAAK